MGASSFVFIVALVSPAFCQTKDIKLPNSNSPDTKVTPENDCRQMRDKVLLRYSRRATAPSTVASLDLVLELLVQRCLVQHWTRLILDQLFVYLSSPIVSWPIICQAQSTNYLSSPIFHRQCLHPRQVVEGGRDRRMGRRGNKLVRKIWFNLSKQKERHYLRRYTGCLFFTGIKVPCTRKLI